MHRIMNQLTCWSFQWTNDVYRFCDYNINPSSAIAIRSIRPDIDKQLLERACLANQNQPWIMAGH